MNQTVGFGSLTLSSCTVTVLSQLVSAPFNRVSSLAKGAKVAGTYREFLAGATPHFGKFFSQDLKHPDGTIFMVSAGWKRKGSPLADGTIFLRTREDGAEWNISARLPDSVEHNLGDTFPVLRARGDLLSLAELPQFGLTSPGWFRAKNLDPEQIDECFVFDRVSQERTARPSILSVPTAGGGVKIVEVAAAPVRRMRITPARG